MKKIRKTYGVGARGCLFSVSPKKSNPWKFIRVKIGRGYFPMGLNLIIFN